MRTSTIGFFIPVIIFVFAALLHYFSDSSPLIKKASINCIVGKTYIRKVTFDDPFTPARIDTIQILDRKKGYVKYRHTHTKDTSVFYSMREKYFIEDLKPLN